MRVADRTECKEILARRHLAFMNAARKFAANETKKTQHELTKTGCRYAAMCITFNERWKPSKRKPGAGGKP